MLVVLVGFGRDAEDEDEDLLMRHNDPSNKRQDNTSIMIRLLAAAGGGRVAEFKTDDECRGSNPPGVIDRPAMLPAASPPATVGIFTDPGLIVVAAIVAIAIVVVVEVGFSTLMPTKLSASFSVRIPSFTNSRERASTLSNVDRLGSSCMSFLHFWQHNSFIAIIEAFSLGGYPLFLSFSQVSCCC